MQVSNSYNFQPAFGVNLNSPRLRYSQKDFFIRIRGYGKNRAWANEVKKVADSAVYLFRKKTEPESVLKHIALGISYANKIPLDLSKRIKTGVLRAPREDWESVDDFRDLKTSYTVPRYKSYARRLDMIAKNPFEAPYKNIAMSYPVLFDYIYHDNAEYVNNSLNLVFELTKKIIPKYIKKEVKPENLNEINDVVAEIRWILAHATPWLRGSDAISNVFMRVIYKAIGIKAYPPAKGISFDLEAYCRSLDDYKANFNSFFEKPLKVIE